MPDYYVGVVCKECGEKHSAQVRIFLANGPVDEMSVAEFYKGTDISQSMNTLMQNTICICPKTGSNFKQTDPQKVFLRRQVLTPPVEEKKPPVPSRESVNGRVNVLERLARGFSENNDLPITERQNAAAALRAIAGRPAASKTVIEVLSDMLF